MEMGYFQVRSSPRPKRRQYMEEMRSAVVAISSTITITVVIHIKNKVSLIVVIIIMQIT
jgi:hypothetical protein